MFQQLIIFILNNFFRHKAVNTAKYQSRILINAQGNNLGYQAVIEDDPYFEQSGNGTMRGTFNIDVINSKKNDTLNTQSTAFQVAVETIARMGRDQTFLGLVKVDSYDVQMVSHFTDDDSDGVRISLTLAVPEPVDMCTTDDNFDDDKEIDVNIINDGEDTEIDIPEQCDGDDSIDLKPIRLREKG